MIATWNRIASTARYGFDLLRNNHGRRQVTVRDGRADQHARGQRRERLNENADELARNYALTKWMVRRHLDYVAAFRFRATNDSDALNEEIERLVIEDETPERMDVAARLGREKFFRVAEARRVMHGDSALLKLNDGRIQGIHSNLFGNPDDVAADENWFDGVRIARGGRHITYGFKERERYTGKTKARRVDARRVIYYGFSDDYGADSVRSTSPLVAALEPMIHLKEHYGYAQTKAKVQALLALAFFREGNAAPGTVTEIANSTNLDENGDPIAGTTEYEIDFSDGRPQILNLEPGDRAEMLTADTPGSDLEVFTKSILMIALKSLDIPYSFYDEKHTNFFGSRAAWLHYERSCEDKRADQREMRRAWMRWKLRVWIRDGRLTLPEAMTVDDVQFEWVPRGMPWWDPTKEVAGSVGAVKAGFDTPQRVARRNDSDVFENLRDTAKVIAFAKDLGMTLSYGPGGAESETVNPQMQPARDNPEETPEDPVEEEREQRQREGTDDANP